MFELDNFKSVFSQQIYKQRMLDKYQSFVKLSKSPECSIYTAFNRQLLQNVLIKRINTRLTWNEMLAHPDIQIINKSKIFPKMTEIFKHKGQFFIALQKPSANSLAFGNSVEKIPQQTFYQLFSEFLQGLRDIQTQHINTKLVPEWIFFHRNSLKLVHFQNFLVAQNVEKKHVITYGKQPENPQFHEKNEQQIDFTPQIYKKSIVFNLGVVAFRLLTGKKQEDITSKEKYEEVVADIRQNSERQIIKITGDAKLANFITKMLADNYFEVPNLNTVCNFFQSRVRQKQKLKMFKDRTMDIELEKIHIGINKEDKKPRQKLRRCCIKEQKIMQKNTKEKILGLKHKLGIQSQAQILSTRKNILVLPYLSTNRNHSCLNRHNPLLSNTNRLKTTIKNHNRSSDYPIDFDY